MRCTRRGAPLTRWLRALFGLGAAAIVAVAAILAFFRLQAHERETHEGANIAPPTGRFVKAADVEIFVQEAGPADAPAVLFVHGTGAWSETWREAMTSFRLSSSRSASARLRSVISMMAPTSPATEPSAL